MTQQPPETPDFHRTAKHLVESLSITMHEMRREQAALFAELGYSAPERFALSVRLAESFYRTGLFAFGVTRLHDALSEGELQALVYAHLCRDTEERLVQLAQRWITRSHTLPGKEAPPHVRLFHSAPTEALVPPAERDDQPRAGAEEGAVPGVRAGRGRFGRGAKGNAAGRRILAQRTAWHL